MNGGAEHVRRAAGSPQLQAGQRAAWSGRSERMAATRRPSSVAGRHYDDSEFLIQKQRCRLTAKLVDHRSHKPWRSRLSRN